MIILKSLLSGGNTTQPTEISVVKGGGGRGGVRGDTFISEDKRINEKIGSMEFMYCIPDLEVFIDKTIKKCLLEYDLDANDTEAVLDDMEKAWPKSPPRSSEKQVLKDCNDNSQKGRSNRQDTVTNQFQEATLLDTALEKDALKGGDTVIHSWNGKEKDSREKTIRLLSKKEERLDALPNGKKELEHAVFEGDRSDTSSPDVTDGQSQARKHPKLKSLLQQRYFGGQESFSCDKGQPGKKAEEKPDETWGTNKQMSSNLELLASAADIHTVSARGTEEHRMQAIIRLQEESERQFQVSAAKCFPTTSAHESAMTSAESSGWKPVLLKLVSSSSSSSPMQEFNNHDSDIISGHHSNSLRTVSPESGQRSSPGRSANEDPHLMANLRQQVHNSTLFFSRDKTQQLFQAHKNGYHAHTPPETVVVRRDMTVISNEGNMKSNQMLSSVARSSLPRDNNIDLTSFSTQYNNFATTPRSQLLHQNHLDRHHNYPESFVKPLHYHGSRIENIIAEELQKDDDRVHETRTHPSVSRTINEEIKPSDINEPARIRSFSLPGTYRRATPSKSANYVPQVSSIQSPLDINYKAANPSDHAASTQSRTVIQILPAHYAMTNTHSGSSILSSHLGHTNSIGSNTNSCFRDIEDQPQDLSTKSRRNVDDKHESHYSFVSNQTTAATDSETRKYFSTPISQLSSHDHVTHIESNSPCSHSDRECDCEYRSDKRQIKTYELERKGKHQGFDICPEEVKDRKIPAKNRRPKTMNVSSETRDSETLKRRKLE